MLFGGNLKNKIFKAALLLTFITGMFSPKVYAANFASNVFETDKLVDLITLSSFINYNADTNNDYAANKDAIEEFKTACQKFSQSNVKTAYKKYIRRNTSLRKWDFLVLHRIV
ncbi:MAG: hypothetical protein BHW64_02095 [Candidatus Melainabacteria bacterium LEY3_CP_29_8]|nr:MAG: hypothetical protein BHW64_02095 [Candidatus Melainabacteria bacterium LEY3_CP_29_8]